MYINGKVKLRWKQKKKKGTLKKKRKRKQIFLFCFSLIIPREVPRATSCSLHSYLKKQHEPNSCRTYAGRQL